MTDDKQKRKKRSTAEVILDDFRRLEGPSDTSGRSDRVDLVAELYAELSPAEQDNCLGLMNFAARIARRNSISVPGSKQADLALEVMK